MSTMKLKLECLWTVWFPHE